MKQLLLLPFLGLFVASLHAQTANDIIVEAELAKIAKLEVYVDKNPKAKDLDEAMEALLDSYEITRQPVKALQVLQARYNAADKLNVPPQELVYGVIQPMYVLLGEMKNVQGAQTFFAHLKRDFEKHPDPNLKAYIEALPEQFASEMRRPKVGSPLEIKGTDINGKAVDTSAMKGKVILVDFWATWCGPCIRELPDVKAAYEKYNEKGFEIVAISLDKDLAALKRFITKEQMPWAQICDGKGWESEWAANYGITGIPATFLIGKNGTVVASDLRGPDVAELVAAELDR